MYKSISKFLAIFIVIALIGLLSLTTDLKACDPPCTCDQILKNGAFGNEYNLIKGYEDDGCFILNFSLTDCPGYGIFGMTIHFLDGATDPCLNQLFNISKCNGENIGSINPSISYITINPLSPLVWPECTTQYYCYKFCPPNYSICLNKIYNLLITFYNQKDDIPCPPQLVILHLAPSITNIDVNSISNDIVIQPQPVKNELILSLNNSNSYEDITIMITDSDGRNVFQHYYQSIRNELNISTKDFINGSYFISFQKSSKIIYKNKFVINKG